MSSKAPQIAIIGGGPGGLVLLLTLLKRGIPATLYEREADQFSRAHLGGSLDLRWETGQRALRENGLEDVFYANSRADGDFYTIADSAGNILLRTPEARAKDVPKEQIRPEIDRRDLRRILLDAIAPEHIKWGHGLASARPLGNGQHELTFTNGATTTCDVLVGADGAHSRVRPLVSPDNARPLYTGITNLEVTLPAATITAPAMAAARALVGRGTLMAVKGSRSIGAQLNSDGRVRAYAMLRAPEDWPGPGLAADPAAVCAATREDYAGWAPALVGMLDREDVVRGEREFVVRPLYMLPVGHRWAHVDGVTLIGDAAHLMGPFAGMGANLAMFDGLECGLALAEAVSKSASAAEREAALAGWEERMFAEGEKWARITASNMEGMFSENAPECMLDTLQKHMGLEAPSSK